MIGLGDWRVKKGEFPLPEIDSRSEFLCWQDSASPLRVSRLGAAGSDVYRLRIGTGLIVDVCPDRRIITRAAGTLSPVIVDNFLADIVLPRLLSHDGEFVLHAGGISIGDGALMFMGLSGRGKSTLATSFHRAGCDFLGDDAMIISSLDTLPSVRAVYPSLRLFPDSIDALMPGAGTAGTVTPHSAKHRIALIDPVRAENRLPLRAIFSIGEPAGPGIEVRRLSLPETCMALVENSFALDPSDTIRARARLRDASALARKVPAFEIAYPRDYARLPEVRQLILDQVAALEPA